MDGDGIKTAFHDVQAAIGGTFVEIGGWLWCKGFGDTAAEHRAVRDDVAVWDISPLRKWELRGPDALAAAQRVHSNDVLRLEVGQVHYGALLDDQGMMVDDGTVFKLADDRCWVMINGTAQQPYFDDATRGMNVSIEWVTPTMPHLGIVGPRSREVVSTLCDRDISGLRYYRFVPEQVNVGGVPVWLSRTGFGGEMGYELFTRPEHAEDLWKVVVDEAGVPPFGVDAIEILRIEAGMIVAGFDYEPHTRSPYDFSLDRFVKLDAPGDFVGKGELRDVAANPPYRFKTLKLDGLEGDQLPEYGADVLKKGEVVGTLGSPTMSPGYGKIGIATIRADLAVDGTRLEVAFGGAAVSASVDVLPIYDPEKKRPRA